MMDNALKTHKETSFGWVLLVEERLAAGKAWLARRARKQAADAAREVQAKPRRYLGPR
jgi:hypothetical protein